MPRVRPGGDGARADAPPLSAGPADVPHPAVAGRVAFLDVLRGVAILGILPINAWSFAYPIAAYDDPGHPPGGGSALAVALVKGLFEAKFITLFSLLFGVGMGVQWLRAQAAGRAYGPPMARRLVVLVGLGALHATLLWYGDIVFVYGLIGLVLCWFAWGRPDVLAWVGAVALLPTLALLGLQVLAAVAMPDAMEGASGPWNEVAAYQGGTWGEIAAVRAASWGRLLVFGLFFYGPRLGGLFLIGMGAAKSSSLLAPGSPDGARLHRRIALAGLAIGVPLEGVYALASVATGSWTAHALADVVHYFGSLALAAGYASSVALLVARAPGAMWTRPLAAIGRTAFSCYIGQSVVMTTIFYAYGLGRFDRVSRWELWGLVGGLWALQLVLAPLWLRVFRSGPLEWVWRTATHLRPQPLLRRDA